MLVTAAILYGSLYPFSFHVPHSGGSALLHLLGTWRQPPQSRGDLLANILLYIPLGFSIGTARARSPLGKWDVLVALAVAGVLSFCVEWIQYYDESRVSCLSDFYLNVLGCLFGWGCSRAKILDLTSLSLPKSAPALFARILIVTWLAWRLFPYVPTIDLHKYWNSLKPVFLTPSLDAFAVFRFTLLWLAVGFLLQLAVQPRRLSLIFLPAIAAIFFARILIVDQVIVLSDICGAALAVVLAPLILPRGSTTPVLAALFLILVIASRVLPWHFGTPPKAFEWLPFYGFLHGSLRVNLMSFLEKFFLYGTLLLLLLRSGMALGLAATIECLALLATSVLEIFMSARSGEVTDAVMALILALIYVFLRREYGDATSPELVRPRSQS